MVEVMVVVAIIGIMAAIGIPSFIAIVPRIRLNNSVMILSNEIALARVRAISKSNDYRIVFNTADESYNISKFAAGAWQSLGITNLKGTDLFSAAGFNLANTLIVSGNGQVNVPLNAQAVLELRTPDGMQRKQIVIEPSGRVFVTKWTGSSWVRE
jgi:type II secretory pathway pseudopilin PulG